MPGLLHDLDALKAGAFSQQGDRAIIALRAEMLLAMLQQWRETMLPVSWARGPPPPRLGGLPAACAVAFHHMLLLLVEELCFLLDVPWPSPASLPSSSVVTPGLLDASAAAQTSGRGKRRHALASEILRLAETSINIGTYIYGVLSFVMALHVAHDCMVRATAEMEGITRLMDSVMAGHHGFHIARQHQTMYKAFTEAA